MGTDIGTKGSRYGLACVAALVGLSGASAASAQGAGGGQPAAIHCDALPQIKPVFGSRSDTFENNFDCLAWQDLIYLMWPAKADERGAPDATKKLGANGPTVWETYRTVDTVFLPKGRDPGVWQQPQLVATLQGPLAQQVASGAVRHLTMTSKVSPEVAANISSKTAIPPPILDEIRQAGGGILYDLNGHPVYYEVAIDKPEYDYIRRNKLYNAGEQTRFARTNVISLPAGTADRTQNPTGAVEVKAAWKVLSQAESRSGRFRTMQALVGASMEPVTVGLVGFHIFIVDGMQGGWATFSQMDNAPTQESRIEPSATFNFFNPNCTVRGTSDPCPVNVENANPGQVMQITPNAAVADRLNAYMHSILQQCQAQQRCDRNPWQYYNLIDVQWPKHPVIISKIKPPASPPLPEGTPNVPLPGNDMLNPVTETFLQLPPRKQIPIVATGASCLGCHQFASTAGAGTYATSYSFIFDRAKQ